MTQIEVVRLVLPYAPIDEWVKHKKNLKKDCEYYTQVYKANDDPDGPPYGLALDSKNQYLFWSTYKIMGATIKRADLTANE